jgi:pyruvate/2-oxoglutarate dehydrogenase complex dihydrolipoamide acyltransferase (E2) component
MPLGRRPLMRTVGRTAVIAGTATAVHGRVQRRQDEKYAQQDQQAYAEQQAAAPPPAPAPAPAEAGPSDEAINKLKELAQLKDQGILTQEEFDAQKAKILAEM